MIDSFSDQWQILAGGYSLHLFSSFLSVLIPMAQKLHLNPPIDACAPRTQRQVSLRSRSSRRLSRGDLTVIASCMGALIYFTFHDPLFVTVLGCISILFMGAWHVSRAIPLIERTLPIKIRFWHVAAVVLALTAVLSLDPAPAHAIFLTTLEQFFINTFSTNANGSVDAASITLTFNLIRGVFLLLAAAAALFAYNQSQQGNDWRPIAGQVALAFGVVIGIDVITFLFVGAQNAA